MRTTGHATASGTRAYADGFPLAVQRGFYRDIVPGLTVGSLGIGSYLGDMDAVADANYEEAVLAALRSGINFIDTSLNYRNQRSERNIGAAIARSGVARESFVVCTKAGYLVPGATPEHVLETLSNMHSMHPDFLADQLERSRANLGLDCIDVFYLHNPETQFAPLGEEAFYARIRSAFEQMEALADAGRIRYYGAATWNGFRQKDAGLSLQRLAAIAADLRGPEEHRFRFIQLPFNLAMTEALTQRDSQQRNILDHAKDLGITVVASASLLQSRLSLGLPPVVAERLPGLETDAQRAIQFVRSTPGITVALVGMGRPSHVASNVRVANTHPASIEEYLELFR